MEFSATIRSVAVRPGAVYVRVGKSEVEIPRGNGTLQEWMAAQSEHRLEMMVALALREQLSIDPVLANAPAALANKRVVVTVTLE